MNEKAKKALEELLQGNENFLNGKNAAVHRTVNDLKALQHGQSPIACVVTCSDSRVIPELIFDMGFGDIFTVRCAGAVLSLIHI